MTHGNYVTLALNQSEAPFRYHFQGPPGGLSMTVALIDDIDAYRYHQSRPPGRPGHVLAGRPYFLRPIAA
jgi:hypothetical protein